jgi:hypothetical protein
VSTDKDPWASYYDDETRRVVERRFGKDLERFGYKFQADGSERRAEGK